MIEYRASITKDEINDLPVLEYPNHTVVVVDNVQSLTIACRDLYSSSVIGFDTETKPSFTKGQHNKVALVQLSTANTCYLFRVNKIGFPSVLADILANPNIIKVGLSLRDDFNSLAKRIKLSPKAFVDIQTEIHKLGITDLSLQKIYAIIFGKKISKAQRLTNWEAESLSVAQQNYAAIDAFACVDIYNVLMSNLQKK